MDIHTPPAIDDDEAERLCLEAALAEARRDPRPNIPNEMIEQKLLKKMGEGGGKMLHI
jgi:hypothetical protein